MQGVCAGLRLPAVQTQGAPGRAVSSPSPGDFPARSCSGAAAGQRCPPALSPGQRRLPDRARLSCEQNFGSGWTDSHV